ncbi:MAG: aminomethyltransferase family protein [Pseudomonadota bacterium]
MRILKDHFRQALSRTPFHDRLRERSATEEWMSWNGYKVPRILDKLSREYFAVRSGCSVLDMTPMEKYQVTGPDSRLFLNRLVTRNIEKLRPGRVTYVAWCDDDGKIIDDGTLFQFSDDQYRLCSQHHQLDWLLISASGFDVDVQVETHDVAALAVQGPTSYAVLTATGFSGVEKLKPFDVADFLLGEIKVSISRTGYTGDLGYELWMDPKDGAEIWDAIFGVTHLYDVQPMGLTALEMVRIEAGFIMPGFDFNTAESTIRDGYSRSPYEVGLDWLVDLNKGHFTGQAALAAEKQRPLKRKLEKLVVEGNKPVGESFIYNGKKGKRCGEVKCTTWSPILKANLALAEIEYTNGKRPSDLWTQIDYKRELKWHTTWAKCHAQSKPFYQPKHRNETPGLE